MTKSQCARSHIPWSLSFLRNARQQKGQKMKNDDVRAEGGISSPMR